MKKICLFSLVLALFITSGCTKNYKTVDEYIEAMNQVKGEYNNTYTISATLDLKEPRKITNGFYRTNVKNNKWKLEMSEDNGENFQSAMLFDGNEILIYSNDSPYAMVSPLTAILNMEKDQNKKDFLINTQNPLKMLYNWEKSFDPTQTTSPSGQFVNNNEVKNEFKCRLIQFEDGKEVCVNDKTGIAVYLHASTTNPRNPNEKSELTINLKNFDSTDLPDSTFNLPEGKQKMSFETMLKDMTKMFKDLKM